MSNKEDEEEKRLYRCARTYNKIVGQVVCNVYLTQFILLIENSYVYYSINMVPISIVNLYLVGLVAYHLNLYDLTIF